MEEVVFEPHVGFNSIRQRHQALSEAREFDDAPSLPRSNSSNHLDFIFGGFEASSAVGIRPSSPGQGGRELLVGDLDPNSPPPHSLLSMLASSPIDSPPRASSASSSEMRASPVAIELDENDFECSLCYRLFYLPVTTTCGAPVLSYLTLVGTTNSCILFCLLDHDTQKTAFKWCCSPVFVSSVLLPSSPCRE